ncbi:erythrocyte membrane protein 1, PfEMP1, putative [Plasmodium gaboni]|uniref:Erythrocyte membrane protein 1, PfEMP1, putative n=1 Tax=Plasmodium gaboni TaxID=647221 RepID=A0ABY0KWF0_9APIC|nr:erythrocyte membrane protein 1, PfEMP1, putative [Plasmodium gaboni]
MGSRGSKFRDETLEKYKKIIGQEATTWGYGEYIHFLTQEINSRSWNDNKYDTFLSEKGWNPRSMSNTVNKICAWEKVQKDIFQAVMDSYSTTPFTWEEKAEKLIENARNDHFNKQTCDNFNHQLVEEIDIVPDVKEKKCKLNTVEGLCLPGRREKFQFSTISDNIRNIKSGNEGNDQQRSITALTTAIGTLAKQITEDIVPLKSKYPDNKDLCKFLRRTYADYKDIIEGKDIVDNKTSKALQCLLNETKKHLTEPNSALSLLEKYFKDVVERKLNEERVYLDVDKKSPCLLDDSSYTGRPQCLRFLEEWFEDYSKEKERFETNIKDICLEGKTKEVTLYNGSKQKYRIPCSQYCSEYERLLSKRKTCYNNYISKCKENLKNHDNYKDTSLYNTEVESIQRITKDQYHCSDEDCKKNGKINLDPFFDPKKLSTNKTYCCGCLNDPRDIKEIFGTKNNKSTYIDAILNKLSICAIKDDTLDGTTNGKIRTDSGNETEICMINYSDSFLKGTGTCVTIPCMNNHKKGKSWICDSKEGNSGERLKSGCTDATESVCLPPRTQRLCLGRIYDKNCIKKTIEYIDTNEQLLNELVLAARYEGRQLYDKYKIEDKTKNRNEDEKMNRLCNAAKYSFADLGDIVKGTSIWGSDDIGAMENNLKTIFAKIYNKVPRWKKTDYEDTDKNGTYKKLREVWWNTNREHIWKALRCGAQIKNNCGGDVAPNIDYMPQFLRWMVEWSEEFCEEKKTKFDAVANSCQKCNKGNVCVPGSVECKGCSEKCKDYQTFINDAKAKYTKQKLQYEKQINDIIDKYKKMRTNFYDDNIQKNTEDEFYNFLNYTNRDSGYFLNNYIKNKNLCNDSHIGGSSKNIDFTNVNQTFNDTPDGYENECSCNNNTSQSKKKPGSSSENSNSQNINIRAHLNKDACLINENYDGVYGGNNFPCNSKTSGTQKNWECNFNKGNGFSLKQSWSKDGKGACLPPRTQELCLGNLDQGGLKDKIDKTNNDGNDKNRKLLEELILAAKYDGEKLWEKNQNKNDNRSICLQLRNSYADYGDLVKGTSIWGNTKTQAAEKNIGNILNDIFKEKLKSEYDNDPIKLRKAWWEENKKDIWDAITCGIPHNEIFVIRKKPPDGRGIEYRVTGKCGYSQEPPKDDEIPQFLRWFKEWSNDFCQKYTEEKKTLETNCQGCDGTKGTNCQNNNTRGSTCSQCVSTCERYKTWITNQHNIYNEQKNKYTEKIAETQNSSQRTSSGNTDNIYFENLIDKKINSAVQYLESSNYETHCRKYNDINFNNVDTTFNDTPLICQSCDDKKKETPGVDGAMISTKEELEKGQTGPIYTNDITNNCMGVEELPKIQPTQPINTVSSSSTSTLEPNNQNNQNMYENIAYNITVCSSADPSLYGAQKNNFNSEWTIKSKQNPNNKDVEIDKKSSDITYEDSVFKRSNGKGECSGKPCKNSKIGGIKWIWTEKNGGSVGLKKGNKYANKIGIPPRTQVLCFGNIHGDFCDNDAVSKVTTNEQLLIEWVIAAKLEGENLKNNYRNNNDKLCRSVKYSFADIGDLIKGTSIWENKWTNLLEKNLQKIFENIFKDQYKNDTNKDSSRSFRYQSLGELREIWWNTNKKFIWHALYKEAGLNSTNKCSGIDENFTPTIDHIPQFLRFMQEWIEHLCEQRKKKIEQAIKSCKDCKEEQEKHNDEKGKDCWKNGGKGGKDSKECETCKSACEEYKNFISGNDNDKISWRERWKNIYEKYMELIKNSLNSENDGTMSCGVDDRGIHINCPKPDILSFFKHLYDQGYTTPSSYLTLVIKNNICGDDKPYFSRVVDNNENNQNKPLTAPYGSVFGDKPAGYKYACECRIPSREEICDDKGLYSNDWKCGNGTTAGTSTGVVDPTQRQTTISPSTSNNYEICTTKNMITTSATNTVPSTFANNTLDAEDHNFFNWFDIWYHDIQTQIDKYVNRVEKTCSDEQIKNNIFPGNNHNHNQTQTIMDTDKCKECKGNCDCYNLWTEKIENQWQKQKKNYNIFNNKQKRQHGEHNATRKVSLGNYLFFSCWEKYIKQHLKGDWEQIKSLDSETLDLLEKKCGKSIHDGENIFNERIKNVKKKGKDCDKRHNKCTFEDKNFKCDKYEDVQDCNTKKYDNFKNNSSTEREKKWDCKDQNTATDTKDVCVPPRTQTLCVANLADSKGKIKGNWSNENDLKKYLQNVMKKETENIYDYYKEGTPIITTKGDTDKNGLPKNFCKAAERTYNDFKHMVLGDMLSKAPSIKAIGDKIKTILEKSGTTRQEWWEEHEYDFWNAIKCGIQTQKKTNGEKFSGNECGYHPPNDTDDPFVWWFKEWGQQFCIEKQKHMKDINEKCHSKVNGRCDTKSGGKQELKDQCQQKCNEYKQFISDKSSQWNKQKSKYEREHSGMKAQELLGLSYPECVGTNFENIFEEEIPKDSKKSNTELKYPYGDSSYICSCDEQKYDCKVNVSTCKEKTGDVTSWRTGLLKIGTNGQKLRGVYAPPRRQKLCLANLHPINFGNGADIENKKNTLLNRLQIVAEREAYYLWKQHTSGTTSTTAVSGDTIEDKRACCAIRRSFFDIGDIVKGTDLWHDIITRYIDGIIYDIFKEELEAQNKKKTNNQIHPDKIRYVRKKWWEGNRKSIWEAMKCGVKNAMTELKKNGQTVSDDQLPDCLKDKNGGKSNFDSIPTPQFVRWLEEWTHQFCEKYNELMSELKTKCTSSGSGGNHDCNSGGKNGETTCKTACTKYNDWIKSKKKEWDGMSKYYEDVKGKDEHLSIDRADYGAVIQPTAIKYLNQKCNKEIDGKDKCCHCENVGKDSTATQKSNDPLEHMDNVVNRNDDKYKKYLRRCNNCYIQHINDQINEIQNILDTRRKKEEGDAKIKYAFDCEINGSQGNGGDTLCNKLSDNVNPEEPQKLKVPIDPDEKHTDKNKENDGMNCGGIPSNESDYKWKSKGGGEYNWVNKLNNNIQIPPRRQKLCYKIDGSKTEHELKYKLFRAAANDAYNVGIKYPDYKDYYGIKPCKALQYSFRDYYNIIMGTDNLEDEHNGTNKAIKESLENYKASNSKKTDDQENRKNFWNDNKECLWRIMKCGYEKGRGKGGNGVPELTTEEGGGTNNDCKMPEDTKNSDQFLSWMQEWYEDYCNIRTKLKSDVETNCEGDGKNFDCKTCPTSCNKYKEYMNKKKEEWDKQKEYYSEKKNRKASGYTGSKATEYLKKNFPNSCGDQQKSGVNVETNIDALSKPPSYYDVEDHCGCNKYIQNAEYDKIKGLKNCEGLKSAAEDKKSDRKIMWRNNKDTGYDYLTKNNAFNDDPVPEQVYLPPRKQNLCFQGLDGEKNNVKTEDTLKEQLMKVAATEGYNLGQYYKTKKEKEDQIGKTDEAKKYSYDVAPCSALKYSFLDLRSIILGYDMTEPKSFGTENNLSGIFKNGSQTGGDPGSEQRKDWWNEHKKCVWSAMKCGYRKGTNDPNNGTKESDKDLENCKDPPQDSDYPIGKDRNEGKEYQFLRWFTEWAEDFCTKQTKQLVNLKKGCEGYECNNEYTEEKKNNCEKACDIYKEFIQKWNEEYVKQSKKYNEVKKNVDINGIDDVKNSYAYQYLHKQLEKNCGKNDDCKCMQKVFTQLQPSSSSNTLSSSGNDDMSASLNVTSGKYGEKCNCPKPEKMNCVQEASKQLKEEAKNNVNSDLKGNGNKINSDCSNVDEAIQTENGTIKIDKHKLEKQFPQNGDSCETEGKDRFDVGKKWNCVNIGRKLKDICIPPRREHMCIKKINDMMSYKVDNKDKLLEEVMKAARNEGIDILTKLGPQNQNEFSEICDAMKYSFADIGDIIRGRDLWNKDNKRGVEQRLQRIFRNIYDKLGKDKNKYNYDGGNFYKLREEWWNTNRKNIWKAMTCVAPKEAKFQKKDNNGTTSSHDKCGYNKITPVDDYIPQRFRWLTEWSENYCKGKKKKLAELKKECDKCEINGSSCQNDTEGKICEKCKEKCTSFGKFVKEWQEQFNKQSNIYKDLYEKANNSSTINNDVLSRSTQRGRRKSRTIQDDDNKRTDNFLKEMKTKCVDDKVKTAQEYLDKTTKCIPYKFTESDAVAGATSNDDNYAFNDKPPNGYENKCKCEPPDPLDKCPDGNTNTYDKVFKNLSITKTCQSKNFNNDLDSWTSVDVKNTIPNNKGVLVPPRRRQLCLKYISRKLDSIENKNNFKKMLLDYVFTEGKLLGEKYGSESTKALQAMKYSFADYGDIVKGTDMMEGILDKDINEKLNKIFSNNDSTSTNSNDDQKQWWDNNKKHVWNAMLCGYKSESKSKTLDNTWCPVPKEDDTPQFLRWLEEWAKIFCDEKQKEAKTVVDQCLKKLQEKKPKTITEIGDKDCKQLLNKYRDWYLNRNRQWKGLKEAYNDRLSNGSVSSSGGTNLPSTAQEYVTSKCQECDCNYNDLDKISQYENDAKELYKKLIYTARIDSIDPSSSITRKIFNIWNLEPNFLENTIKTIKDTLRDVSIIGTIGSIYAGKEARSYIIEKVNDLFTTNKDSHQPPSAPSPSRSNPQPQPGPVSPPQGPPSTTPQNDQADVPINDILSSTLPVGISFALGSIALLFYMKKKPKLGPTKLFRVIDIPQNDYNIPTNESTNRYVPYSKYKGKTYIYVERDGDSEDDKYMFTSDTTDVTSSSESEYEEMDINDIYPYKSPKYKTLIELVLKPSSKTYDAENIHIDNNMEDSTDTPINKLTDEEWNQLKQDFISQYLNNIGTDVPLNNELQSDNIPNDTQPYILPNNMDEKPFITSIQDRYLDKRHEDVTYNIDWIVQENITTNNVDIPKYVTSNDQYTGIDLINDSLNSGNNIYNELLKRKENELYGTKHPKHTSTNSVVKETYSDPISNEIDLFHKWLDRHRDMCNQWNNKEEMLNQLNKEWNKENKEHLLYTSNIDDINRINDENYNMINENTQINHEGNDKTSVEHLESTNIPYNDLTTTNTNVQTKNLRTNVSMDIYFDENNNNVTNEDDQLENSYNF